MATLEETAMGLIDMDLRMEELAWRAQVMASAVGLPDQFIAGIGWRKAGPGHWQLFNSWMGANYHTGIEDVPLALFFEGGTEDHWVQPVYAKALSWDATYAGKAFPGSTGRAYSRGHVVSGLPATRVMAREVDGMRQRLAEYLSAALGPALEGAAGG